ncbi:MAG TPA: hypothetical protein VMX13_04765 [Sedimentisphaerales bacterium]|nr:hypothetical protein [Sedimentisphaerales bacterium]
MTTLTFVKDIVSAVAWPATVIVIILMFKHPLKGMVAVLSEKLKHLIKAKHKETELIFQAEQTASIIEEKGKALKRAIAQGETTNRQQVESTILYEMGASGLVMAVGFFASGPVAWQKKNTRLLNAAITALSRLIEALRQSKLETTPLQWYERVLGAAKTIQSQLASQESTD